MEKELWKWIFQEMDEEKLYQIMKKTDITINGFRKVDREMLRRLRTKVIAHLLKPRLLARVQSVLGDMNLQHAWPKTKQELLHEMKDFKRGAEVLAGLLLSEEEEQLQMAEQLYKSLQAPVASQEIENPIQSLQNIIRNLEEKVKKQDGKVKELSKDLLQVEQALKNKETEIKKAEGEIQELKKRIQEEKERNLVYEYEQKLHEQETLKLREELHRVMKESHKQQIEIETLRAPQAFLISPEPQKTIAVLGDLAELATDKAEVFLSNEAIQQAIGTEVLSSFEYVCLLRFTMTPSLLRKVKKSVRTEQIKEFYNMHEFVRWEASI
ncbi:hypothetical protein P6P90_14155 [Ectobacillus antri]|uniref:Uncharacterized protein n=1 Tax=Ectobacillus antri TaxID=2486280 RepID=A0ABT6H8P6_9BACI|nr:hypothetical protein [Ectobacillus antri]MDG4658021.1 hypothetical protein [Ectobacillus antri]MDG5755089.1 hypothetical protein [Ectobacillus antri]